MKILITGSSGHLGEAIARVLKKDKVAYLGIDLQPSAFTTHVGSIGDKDFIEKCMKGIDAVLHTATLHKPHVATHSKQDFIDTNVMGTLNLLEAAKKAGVRSFIYTSTTSTFGDAMNPGEGAPAVWVTEETFPIPKNIYGATKTAAEDLCQLFSRNHQLPCLVLKTSRFFPEDDDQKSVRNQYADANSKANELLHRRVDIEDIVAAHLLAIEKAGVIGFGKYIISATTPFTQNDLTNLSVDAPAVVAKIYPDFEALYKKQGWKMFPEIKRVYVNAKAIRELGWQPKYDFRYVLDCLKAGKDFRSGLAVEVGAKGYHDRQFEEGPYPVSE